MCDCKMPTVFNESKRKSNILAVNAIAASPKAKAIYFILQGLWDGHWNNYKQCLDCHEIGSKYQDETRECYPIGELIQELRNSDLIENQGDEDDKPVWVSCVEWLQIKSHNPLRLTLNA